MATQIAAAFVRCRADVSQLYADLGSIRGPVVSIIQDVADSGKEAASTIATTILQAVQASLAELGALTPVTYAIGEAAQFLSTTFSTAFGVIGSVFTGLRDAIGPVLGGVVDVAAGAVRVALGTVKTYLGVLLALSTGMLVGIVNGIKDVFTGLGELVGGIVSAVTGVISGIASAVVGVVSASIKGVTSLFEQLLNIAGKAAGKVVEFFAGMLGGILSPAFSAFKQNITAFEFWIGVAARFEAQNARINAMLQGSGEAAGWSSRQLDLMAQQLGKLGSFSYGQLRSAEQVLLRFQNIRGDQFFEALKASRQLASALGVDLPQAAQMLGRALEDPGRGFIALRRAGITLDATQKDLIKTAIAAGDLGAAQDVVLQRLGRLGDVAGAMANTLQGRVQQLTLTWNGMGAALGRALEPLASVVVEFLQPLIEGFASVFRAFVGEVGQGNQGILASARTWIKENRDQLLAWGREAADVVISLVNSVRSGLATAGQWVLSFFPGLRDEGVSVVEAIPRALTATLTAARAVAENFGIVWDTIKDSAALAWEELVNKTKPIFEHLTLVIKNQFLNLWDTVATGFFQAAARIGSGAAGFLTPPLKAALDFLARQTLPQAEQENAISRAERNLEELRLRNRQAQAQDSAEVTAARKKVDEDLARFRQALEEAKNLAGTPAADRRPWWMGPAEQPQLGAPTPAPFEAEDKFKYAFSGLEAFSKKIQESVAGTGTENLARQQIAATKAVKDGVDKQNALAQANNDLLERALDRPGGFAA